MDQIQADKLKLLGMALGMMIVGLSALFIVALLELSEANHLVCAKR